ncbi:MAG: sulfite exporter TauE/SafE family protein [Stellaceae bacterium]
MSVVDWAGMATTSFAAGLLQATSGFGFAVLSLPFFLLFATPDLAIKTCVILCLALSAMAAPGLRRAVDPSLLLRLTLGSLAGLPFGLAAFAVSNLLVVRLAAGTTIAAFTAVLALNRARGSTAVFAMRPGRDLAAGAVSGAANALVGMAGPPVLIYLMLGGAPMRTVRATLLAFFTLVYAATVAADAVLFGMPKQVWLTAASLLPLTWGGGLIGLRLGNRLESGVSATLAILVLGASGVYTIAAVASHAVW